MFKDQGYFCKVKLDDYTRRRLSFELGRWRRRRCDAWK